MASRAPRRSRDVRPGREEAGEGRTARRRAEVWRAASGSPRGRRRRGLLADPPVLGVVGCKNLARRSERVAV